MLKWTLVVLVGTGTATDINNLRLVYSQQQPLFFPVGHLLDMQDMIFRKSKMQHKIFSNRKSETIVQVPLRKGWTKKVPGPSHFGTFHAYYSPTTGLSGGGKWGADVSWKEQKFE